jgi:ABC-2 type transport system permease protein
MFMKKSNITGWKDVFKFTLLQTLKNRAFIISYIILLFLAMVSMPLINMFTSQNEEDPNAPSPVKKVYIQNETTLPDLDFSGLHEQKPFEEISFEAMTEDYDAVANRIEESEHESVIFTITENEGMYSLSFVKASSGPIKDHNLESLGSAAAEEFESLKISALGITEEQTTMLNAKVATTVSMVDVEGNPIVKEDTSISNSEYWFVYGILFAVLMVNSMASGQVATSIVTEKSTRVIEYLLTSVKPLALMIGKILAMLVAVLIQIISMVALLFVSNTLSAKLSSGSGESVMSQYLPSHIFNNLNIPNLILCIVSIVLGLIFYATLAALAGATVSKLEEIQEGLTLFTVTNIIGCYIGLAAANILMGAGDNPFVTFAFLFPLSSPFLLPGSILIGKVGIPLAAAAIALQLIFIFLLLKFVAKVFETLILHNGNTIKPKELFKLSKTV